MKTMTRTEYEKLPKVPGGLWLTDMQTMADELADYYDSVDAGTAPEPDVDEVMKELIQKATESMSKMKEWSDLSFLSYTYWSCMEEMEKWNALAHTDSEERFDGMLRTHVLTAWLLALKDRIGELGGKIVA